MYVPDWEDLYASRDDLLHPDPEEDERREELKWYKADMDYDAWVDDSLKEGGE